MNPRPRILVVDDDHDTLDLLEIILYKNYDVVTALNGFDALKMVEDETPDLIITDIMMPVMNGIRFFNSLRKSTAAHSIPIIALTSFSKEYPAKSLVSMGFSEVVGKPPDSAPLIALIDTLLTHHEQAKKEKEGNKER